MSILEKASIITTPTAYEDGKLLSVYPQNGDADLDFTRGSLATRVNAQGLIEDVSGNDIPRLDYSDGSCPGLLLESQSTNLFTYSEDFSDSSWVKNGFGNALPPVVTLNTDMSPDGTQNASRIEMDCTSTSSSDYSAIYQQLSLDGSSQYTISFYIKSNTSSEQDLLFFINSTFSTQITANSEWQRVESTFTSNSTNPRNFGILARGSVQQDVDILIWGAQLEALPYATSYIPTNGSATTRLADFASRTGLQNHINSEEGVFYVEINSTYGAENRRISISDGSNTNRLVIFFNTANDLLALVRANNSTSFLQTFSTDVKQFLKIALKWKLNDFALWVNGVEVGTSTSGSVPPINTFDQLKFADATDSRFFYGKCKDLIVFNEALSDTELQCLTS